MLTIAALAAVASGCGASSSSSTGSGSTSASSSSKKITVGYSADLLTRPAQADAHIGAQDAAKRLGVNIKFAFAYPAPAQQIGIANLLTQKIDVLAVDPNDSTAIGTSILAANAQHVPVVTFIAKSSSGGKTASFVAANERPAAAKLATSIFQQLNGQGEIAIIQGDKAQEAGANREAGIRDAARKFPRIKVVAYGAAAWDTAKAQALTRDMLSKHPNIAAILTVYDGMAQGAAVAVKAAHSHAVVTGFNGECPTLASIWNGDIAATVDANWRNIGAVVVETAVKAAKGEPVPSVVTTPSYVMDRQIMQQIVANKYPGETSLLRDHINAALHGCSGLGGSGK